VERTASNTPARAPYYQTIGFFLSPKPLLAMFLMILNDHWLKYLYPNWLTGILSDVMGLYFAPLFLLALMVTLTRWQKTTTDQTSRRKAWALISIATIDVMFLLVKTNSWALEIYLKVLQPFLGAVQLIQDPYDLLALLISPFCFRQAMVVESDE
jgi:hypothetical protein